IDIGAEFRGLGRGGVAIGHQEVSHPVWRRVGIALPVRRDSADELLAILDVQIAGVFLARLDLPAENCLIKHGSRGWVRAVQMRPAQRARDSLDTGAEIFNWLPGA